MHSCLTKQLTVTRKCQNLTKYQKLFCQIQCTSITWHGTEPNATIGPKINTESIATMYGFISLTLK